MSEYVLSALHGSMKAEDWERPEVQDLIHEVQGNHIPDTHPDQSPRRRHLRVLKIRRDRDIREWLEELALVDPKNAERLKKTSQLEDRKKQVHSNSDFMAMISKKYPEFKAIFTYYAYLCKFTKNGYCPADQESTAD